MVERSLDPTLIGYNLYQFSNGKDKPTYLALILGFKAVILLEQSLFGALGGLRLNIDLESSF